MLGGIQKGCLEDSRMPLTDSQAKALKPRDCQYKKGDGKGLYLLVKPSGSKLWQHKLRFAGKEKTMSYGSYPEVGVAEARRKRDDSRRLLRDGIDPALEHRKAKAAAKFGVENSFERVATEYIEKRIKEGIAKATEKKLWWFLSLLEADVGRLPIDNVSPQLLLIALKKLEAKGHHETAKKTLSFASRVFKYAVATTRAESDPALLLRDALTSPKVRHYPAITDAAKFAGLLRAIDSYSGYPSTCIALKLAPHVFLRPGELRKAVWSEIDLEGGSWTVPAERMKARKAHSFSLSKQVKELLLEARTHESRKSYVFPAYHNNTIPLSENALTQALRRLGYDSETMTAHGFRASASSLLNESGKWNPDAIERALAHGDSSAVRGAYHRAEYWDERVEMLQWWSDYLDMLKAS